MKTRTSSKLLWQGIGCWVLAGLLLPVSPAVAEDGDQGLTGTVEVLYRNVSQDGSDRKYEEDFDGLGSGGRLANLTLNWLDGDSEVLDYARLDVSGLGGDPYERSQFRAGRKDAWELKINRTKQTYLYDLFELVDNEDGAKWNTERQLTDVGLRVHAKENVQLFFEFQEGQRTGDTLFMKDLERQIFRLETPMDQNMKRYTVGANFTVGSVDILFRQALRRYDNQFNNTTENDFGLEDGSLTSLDHYEWLQNESGGSDWTTLKVNAPLGNRANLSVTLYGTFLGEEEIESRVSVEAEGTTFSGTCSASGVNCSSNLDCEPESMIPGDVCVANPFSIAGGFGNTRLEGDTTMLDADVSVRLAAPLDLHLQYRSLDRDLDGVAELDLSGSGSPTSVETRNDYQIDTASAILDYRPKRQVGLRVGFRTIDRELIRSGFEGIERDVDLNSDDDETIILGLTLKPVKWFRLNADYEDGDITQPFNAVAPQERKHTRVRASFMPQPEMRIDLSYLDFDNTNTAEDLRDPGSFWDTSIEGTTWSTSFWHKASEHVDYLFRYARQEIESAVGINFDTAGFGGTEIGDSIFDNDNDQLWAHVNFSWAEPWKAYVRFWTAESDGDNLVVGDTLGLVNDEMIDQEFTNAEVGLTYTLKSGVFVGASLRDFDYDDFNDRLDYDGQIFIVRLGTSF